MPLEFALIVNYHRLLQTFANGLDPDQVWKKVGPVLDQNCLILMVYLEKLIWKIYAGVKFLGMQNNSAFNSIQYKDYEGKYILLTNFQFMETINIRMPPTQNVLWLFCKFFFLF